MAQDVRPYKSKEQDGQGNEIILRDQQLVEQTSQTTMASGEYFEIVDVDGRMAKIPKDNMIGVVREALGTLLNSLTDQTTVTKVPSLNGNTLGASTVATLASVLGARLKRERNVFLKMAANATPVTHTVPGKPICLLFGAKVSQSDIAESDVKKVDLTLTTHLSDYWCSISGNTISFDFPGYAGNNYGAVLFDVLYI